MNSDFGNKRFVKKNKTKSSYNIVHSNESVAEAILYVSELK